MKRTGLKLTPRLLLVAAVPMIVMFIMAVVGISSSCRSITESIVQHELSTAQYAFEISVGNIAQGAYKYVNGNFFKGQHNVSNNTSFFDNFSQKVDLQVSVFYDNEQVATSLMDKEGNRMTGIEAASEIYEMVVGQGQNYYSNCVKLAGNEYYAMYCPLYQFNKDEIIGMTFVGLRKSTVNTIYMANLTKYLALFVVIFLVGIVLSLVSIQVVVKGIKEVVAKLNLLADGALNIKIDRFIR